MEFEFLLANLVDKAMVQVPTSGEDINIMLPLAVVLFGFATSTRSTSCYYVGGAEDTARYQCPFSNHCCPIGATCTTNGLCQDINNHIDKSLTQFSGGNFYNMTGLYMSGACTSETDCSLSCAHRKSKALAVDHATNVYSII
jgi:hypothetical protein